MSRTSRFAALTLVAAVVAAVLLPVAAANATAYRYWGYYQLKGTSWQFASKGPDQITPADGSVEGWRFAIGTAGSTRYPRVKVTFGQVCGATKAVTGKKRVAEVIDYGRRADTADDSTPPRPVAKCAVVDTAASGSEALAAVSDVRSSKGLVCGIDGFPATGCGDAVKTVTAAAKAPDTPVTLAPASGHHRAAASSQDSSHLVAYIGIGAVVMAVIGLAMAAFLRRRP